jgi:histone H1/5
MSYKEGVYSAVAELKDRTGSSMIAIKKLMQANQPKDKKWLNKTFLTALKSGVAAGDLVQVKNSYKLSADFKKAATKKATAAAKPKAAPKKKTTAKKSAPKKKSTAKKTTTKAVTKKTAPKKAATAKKAAPKKAAPKKAATAKASTKKTKATPKAAAAPKAKAAPKKKAATKKVSIYNGYAVVAFDYPLSVSHLISLYFLSPRSKQPVRTS